MSQKLLEQNKQENQTVMEIIDAEYSIIVIIENPETDLTFEEKKELNHFQCGLYEGIQTDDDK